MFGAGTETRQDRGGGGGATSSALRLMRIRLPAQSSNPTGRRHRVAESAVKRVRPGHLSEAIAPCGGSNYPLFRAGPRASRRHPSSSLSAVRTMNCACVTVGASLLPLQLGYIILLVSDPSSVEGEADAACGQWRVTRAIDSKAPSFSPLSGSAPVVLPPNLHPHLIPTSHPSLVPSPIMSFLANTSNNYSLYTIPAAWGLAIGTHLWAVQTYDSLAQNKGKKFDNTCT